MVTGLELFREHFKEHTGQYVLIGGAACTAAMEEVGEEFRATKDLDIVLCVEALDRRFLEAFWDFIRTGGYRNLRKSTGRKQYYRFHDPEKDGFPVMLELFSRAPDALKPVEGGRLTPIAADDEASSLSAILLEDDYYAFILRGRRDLDGLSVLAPAYLIPIKARAWLDFAERRQAGEKVDGKDVRKHRNDVFRLYRILDPDLRVDLPPRVRDDFERFLQTVVNESVDLGSLGLGTVDLDQVLQTLAGVYGIRI